MITLSLIGTDQLSHHLEYILFFIIKEKIYELKLIVGEDYPDKPPKIKFVTKVNLACVNQKTGWVIIL